MPALTAHHKAQPDLPQALAQARALAADLRKRERLDLFLHYEHEEDLSPLGNFAIVATTQDPYVIVTVHPTMAGPDGELTTDHRFGKHIARIKIPDDMDW